MADNNLYSGWRQHLTEDLRQKFEHKGSGIVASEIWAYKSIEERRAAQVWLADKRKEQRDTELSRFCIIVSIAVVLLATAIAARLFAK